MTVSTPLAELPLADSPLAARRRKLIAALRSGEYRKHRGQLFRGWHNSYGDVNSYGFCCIGVACRLSEDNLLDIHDSIRQIENGSVAAGEEVVWDDTPGYTYFKDTYQVTERTSRYLMGMNDGNVISIDSDKAVMFPYYSDSSTKVIRNPIGRDFKFIARFLEVIWKLS